MKKLVELLNEVQSISVEELQTLVNKKELAENCTDSEKICILLTRELSNAFVNVKTKKAKYKVVLNCDYALSKTQSCKYDEMRLIDIDTRQSLFQLYWKKTKSAFAIVASSKCELLEDYTKHNERFKLNISTDCKDGKVKSLACMRIEYERIINVLSVLLCIRNGTIDKYIEMQEKKKAEKATNE